MDQKPHPLKELSNRPSLWRENTRLWLLFVLSIDPSSLYLIGAEASDPVCVWKILVFQRKTWANELELKRKLFSLKLTDEGSPQDHIKSMIEVFD